MLSLIESLAEGLSEAVLNACVAPHTKSRCAPNRRILRVQVFGTALARLLGPVNAPSFDFFISPLPGFVYVISPFTYAKAKKSGGGAIIPDKWGSGGRRSPDLFSSLGLRINNFPYRTLPCYVQTHLF
jgi:hypothetical protein